MAVADLVLGLRWDSEDEDAAAASTSNPAAAEVLLPEDPIAANEADEKQNREELALNHRRGAEVQRTEAGSGPVSKTLADPDLLDCPICFEPLCSPVYQCENGHIACGSCCTNILKNKCANCCLPIQNSRHRAVEKIVESVRVACQYKPYGCTEMLSFSKKVDHEKASIYLPCSCPCCDFVGDTKLLYHHFALKHNATEFSFNSKIYININTAQRYVILREGTEGVIFVVHHRRKALVSCFNVVCVAPSASDMAFLYELTISSGDNLFKIKTSVEMLTKWTAAQPPSKMSIFVPSNFITRPLLFLDLIITKKPAPAT